jgi:hypothetical protein
MNLGNYRVKVRVNGKLTGNGLLKLVIPMADISSFHEVIPTMNEIFMQVVKAQNQTTKPENHE